MYTIIIQIGIFMDIIKRIDSLREERGWSEYRLREEAQLSSSTLPNMHKRGTLPSMASIEAICNAFGITLSQFFNENETTLVLSDEEIEFVEAYRQLSKKNRCAVRKLIDELK